MQSHRPLHCVVELPLRVRAWRHLRVLDADAAPAVARLDAGTEPARVNQPGRVAEQSARRLEQSVDAGEIVDVLGAIAASDEREALVGLGAQGRMRAAERICTLSVPSRCERSRALRADAMPIAVHRSRPTSTTVARRAGR